MLILAARDAGAWKKWKSYNALLTECSYLRRIRHHQRVHYCGDPTPKKPGEVSVVRLKNLRK